MSKIIARAVAFGFGVFLIWLGLVVFFLPVTTPTLQSPMALAAVYLTIVAFVFSGLYAVGFSLIAGRRAD